MPLLMVHSGTDALSVVDRTSGDATQVGVSTAFGVGEAAPSALAWDGTDLWSVGWTLEKLLRLDPATGEGVVVGTATEFGVDEDRPNGLVWDGTDLWFLGQANKVLYRLDRTTGVAVQQGTAVNFGLQNASVVPTGLTWDGTDLFASFTSPRKIFRLDRVTGRVTEVGDDFTGSPIQSLAWDGETMWGGGSSGLYTIDLTGSNAGEDTFIGDYGTDVPNTGVVGLVWVPNSDIMFASPSKITQVDAAVGVQTITYTITPPSVGSFPITSYQISSNGVSGWSTITLNSQNEYALIGLDGGVEVTRYFRAVSFAGSGIASDPVTATPDSIVQAPSKITQIEVVAGNTEITYTITPPAAGSSAITGYEISDDGTSRWSAITLNADNEYTLTGLVNDVEVTRYFRAVSDAGNGPASNAVTATPVEPEIPVEPEEPALEFVVDTEPGQIYGFQEFRRRYDVIRGQGATFEVVHREIEMVQYTKSSQVEELDVFSLVSLNVHFIPIHTDINFRTGEFIVLSPEVPYTSITFRPTSVVNWLVTGFLEVGGPPSNRLVIVTRRQ